MYKLTFLFFILLTASISHAHQYYFGFAEVEYNLMQERMEGTIILSAHDLEDVLLEKGVISSKLETVVTDSVAISAIGSDLFTNFKLLVGNAELKLFPSGFFLTKNGLIEFYFTSEKVAPMKEIEVEFTTLMEEFPEQQNKITFRYKSNKFTAVFLKEEKRKKIEINP